MEVSSMPKIVSCVLILLCVAVAFKGNMAGGASDHDNFAVFIDAGSSSSKVKMYRWARSPSTGQLDVELVKSTKYKPGISSFRDSPGLEDYLAKLTNATVQDVPEPKRSATPLYLYATAGMRSFPPNAAMNLMNSVRSHFSDKTLSPFVFSPKHAQIISGEEEGAFSWVAVNHLLGFFSSNKPTSESVGVLEMGGASTQIAFIPEVPLYSEEYKVVFGGRQYDIYAQSYYNFGVNLLDKQRIQQVYDNSVTQVNLQDPCMLIGDERNFTLDSGVVPLTGTSNATLCLSGIQSLLTASQLCPLKSCAIGSVYQPRIPNIGFYATGVFYGASQEIGALGAGGAVQIQEHLKVAKQICSRTLQEAEDSGMKEYASRNCQNGMYFPTLFTQAYGFPENTTAITAADTINGKAIDWAFGAILLQLDALVSPGPAMSTAAGMLSQYSVWVTLLTGLLLNSFINATYH